MTRRLTKGSCNPIGCITMPLNRHFGDIHD
jgi:hypothetical protein